MTIIHKISMDLAGKGIAPKFDMVQGDYCTRQIEFHLFSGNNPWAIPDGALVLIRYRRPDKSVGVYNTLPDGTVAYAIEGGNILRVTVAPEALAIPGCTTLVVSISTREQELSTFAVQVEVQANLSSGATLDGNYASITGMLPIPDSAISGQVLVADEVDENGKIRTVKAIDIASTVPASIAQEADRVAALAQSRQTADSVSFLIGADIHARPDDPQSLSIAKQAAQAMGHIRNQVHIDFSAILGDVISNTGESHDQGMETLRTVYSMFSPVFLGMPQFWLKGDNDYLFDDERLTDNEVFSGISVHSNPVTFDSSYKIGGYYHWDCPEHKLRVICLALPLSGAGVGSVQITWLSRMLDLSDKGSDWKCLLLSHLPLNDFQANSNLMDVIRANQNKIIANIHGHLHNQQSGSVTDTNIPQIGIPAICTAFCVATVDLQSHKIYLDHYGIEENQVIDIPL